MRLSQLNLTAALASLTGAVVLLIFGEVAGGLIWLGASLVWLVLSIFTWRRREREPFALRHLLRRLSRLLLYGS
jgi:O-antigen/teichoic acid export membrane protein